MAAPSWDCDGRRMLARSARRCFRREDTEGLALPHETHGECSCRVQVRVEELGLQLMGPQFNSSRTAVRVSPNRIQRGTPSIPQSKPTIS